MTMFTGFDNPLENWSKLPHQLIEALPLVETLGEMKVILYILRHTWGYHEAEKAITLDEFENGRKRKDGTRIDNGVGMSKPSIIQGLRLAETHGFICSETDDSDLARIKKWYSLANRGQETLPQGSRNFTPEVKILYTGGKESLHRSEKETIETRLEKDDRAASAAPPASSQPILLSADPDQTTAFNGELDALFQGALKAEAQADGKRGPQKWGSLAQKQQYRAAAEKIVAQGGADELQRAIAEGLKRERKSRDALVGWLVAWAGNLGKPKPQSRAGTTPAPGPAYTREQAREWYGRQ